MRDRRKFITIRWFLAGGFLQVGFGSGQPNLSVIDRIWEIHFSRPSRIGRPVGESTVLNKFGPSGHGEAQVQYLDGDFRVVSPGTYVRCAISDVRIPLDELKYWSVDLQEAYSVPSAVLQRHFPGALKTEG